MARVPEVVQCDKRGQIVIPKDIREKLGINESDFDLFSVGEKAIFLKLRKSKKGHASQ